MYSSEQNTAYQHRCIKRLQLDRLTAHDFKYTLLISGTLSGLDFADLLLGVLYFPKEPINVIGVLSSH